MNEAMLRQINNIFLSLFEQQIIGLSAFINVVGQFQNLICFMLMIMF